MQFVVVGAGPIGLEAGLAASQAGHDVLVLDAGRIADHVRRWGHVTLFTPWSMNTTPAGRALVNDHLLASDVCPTGAAYVARYLEPIAAALEVREHHHVVSISRPWKRKGDELGRRSREQTPFELLVDTPAGEVVLRADVVLDCTGVFGDPAPAGPGGAPVPGERNNPAVRHGPVPVDDLAGQRVLLVGDGASATTVLTHLLDLQPPAEIHWITPSTEVPGFVSPPDDPLPLRGELVSTAQRALDVVHHHPGAHVERFDDHVATLSDGTSVDAHAVLVCTGFRPDHGLSRELQVHLCWGSEGPMKLAAALLAAKGDGPADCLAGAPEGLDVLRSPEPGFFVLGAKSYGRRSDFLLGVGHQQVLDVIRSYGVP